MQGFVVASKQMAKAKVAMIGPSGAGKTLSSLRFAHGLTNGGKVGVVDSENNSASLYADKFPGWQYFVLPIVPPYTARKYVDAIDLAVRNGLDCLIIDSLTHVWAGEGGLLQQKEALDSRAGSNSFTNWQRITKVHEQLKGKILHSPIHIVTTMRSKQEYILETNDKGKSVPKKVGLKPIQRDDLEYEFTLVLDIAMDHQFMVSKDRTDLFDGVVATVTEQTGADVRAWLSDEIKTPVMAVAAPEDPPAAPAPIAAPEPQEAVIPASSGPIVSPPAHIPQMDVTLTKEEMASLKNARGTVSVTKIVEAEEAKRRQIKNHADGSLRPAPEPTSTIHDSGEYTIKCGSNWGMVGKKMREVPERTITAALAQADKLVSGGVKDPAMIEFAFHARRFLKTMGVAI